jgi:hypothetical protein
MTSGDRPDGDHTLFNLPMAAWGLGLLVGAVLLAVAPVPW